MARFDLTDFEWSVIEPLLPNKSRGVPRVDDRRVLNGIFWRFISAPTALTGVLPGSWPRERMPARRGTTPAWSSTGTIYSCCRVPATTGRTAPTTAISSRCTLCADSGGSSTDRPRPDPAAGAHRHHSGARPDQPPHLGHLEHTRPGPAAAAARRCGLRSLAKLCLRSALRSPAGWPAGLHPLSVARVFPRPPRSASGWPLLARAVSAPLSASRAEA